MKLWMGLAAAVVLAWFAPVAWAQAPTGYESLTFEDVTRKAEAGDAKAQHELGNRYYYTAEHKDDAQARAWFEKAAQQGDPYGEYEFATMCELGEGGDCAHTMAFKWYSRAARDGVREAYADLGVMYEYGDGVTRDLGLAIAWYEKGVSAQERRAEALLGLLFRDGKGVAQDPVRAEELLTRSVQHGWPVAADDLEAMYRQGIGVPADPVTAHAWRTIGFHMRHRKEVEGGYVVLDTPDLSREDNMRAWKLYRAKAEALGLIADDKKISDEAAEKSATDIFTNPPKAE